MKKITIDDLKKDTRTMQHVEPWEYKHKYWPNHDKMPTERDSEMSELLNMVKTGNFINFTRQMDIRYFVDLNPKKFIQKAFSYGLTNSQIHAFREWLKTSTVKPEFREKFFKDIGETPTPDTIIFKKYSVTIDLKTGNPIPKPKTEPIIPPKVAVDEAGKIDMSDPIFKKYDHILTSVKLKMFPIDPTSTRFQHLRQFINMLVPPNMGKFIYDYNGVKVPKQIKSKYIELVEDVEEIVESILEIVEELKKYPDEFTPESIDDMLEEVFDMLNKATYKFDRKDWDEILYFYIDRKKFGV